MVWFIVGMLVLVAGGAAVLFLVFHMTEDHSEPAPFAPDDDSSPLGSTDEHAGEQADSAASEEDDDAHIPPDAPGAPDGETMPVGRYQSGPSDA
jgi:cytoskeletal protein RodZ